MRKTIVEIICILFILLFLYTGAAKLLEYDKFKTTVGQSPLLTEFSGFIAIVIPAIEIVVSAMLMLPRLRLMGLYSSLVLMIVFTIYIIAILNFSENIPCACGGVISTMGWKVHLLFNIIFVILGFIGTVLHLMNLDGNEPPKRNNQILAID